MSDFQICISVPLIKTVRLCDWCFNKESEAISNEKSRFSESNVTKNPRKENYETPEAKVLVSVQKDINPFKPTVPFLYPLPPKESENHRRIEMEYWAEIRLFALLPSTFYRLDDLKKNHEWSRIVDTRKDRANKCWWFLSTLNGIAILNRSEFLKMFYLNPLK